MSKKDSSKIPYRPPTNIPLYRSYERSGHAARDSCEYSPLSLLWSWHWGYVRLTLSVQFREEETCGPSPYDESLPSYELALSSYSRTAHQPLRSYVGDDDDIANVAQRSFSLQMDQRVVAAPDYDYRT